MLISKGKKTTYSAFGLIISSEIVIDAFQPCEGIPDVNILVDQLQPHLREGICPKVKHLISSSEFMFQKNGVRYLIQDGKRIVIELPARYNSAMVQAYITGACMATILLQRSILPMHGSAVVIGGRAAIFTGHSGAGKSSLCHAFRKNQYEYLSDDITVVSVNEEGHTMIQPSFPQQRLCRNTARKLGYDLKDPSLGYVDGKVIINSDHLFWNQPAPLAAVFEISKHRGRRVEVTPVTGTEKLKRLINNINYSDIFKGMGVTQDFFLKCTEIANKISWFELRRPYKGDTTQAQMQCVLDIMGEA